MSSEESSEQQEKKAWHESIAEDMQRTADSAISSARSIQHNSSTHLRSLQDFIPHMKSQYRTYEDAFFKKVKEELMSAREHPSVAVGVAVTAGLILMRGPRRFVFRHTLGRLQSEEAQFVKAENNVKELNLSVDIMKRESKKLLERAALADKDMKRGNAELMNAGNQIQRLAKSVHKVEAQAAGSFARKHEHSNEAMRVKYQSLNTSDVMDGLREIPGREALKLRAEVASMASQLKQQRVALDKKIMKISELGIPV